MKRNNFFSRFIVVTLTAALLLVSGSRAIRVSALADPEIIYPVFDTQIIQLQEYVDTLPPDNLDIFYILGGVLVASQAGSNNYKLTDPFASQSDVVSWLKSCGIQLYNSVIDFYPTDVVNGVDIRPIFQFVVAHLMGDAVVAANYNNFTSFLEANPQLSFNKDLQKGLNLVFGLQGGLYQWQIKSSPFLSPYDWILYQNLTGIALGNYNSIVNTFTSPVVRVYTSTSPYNIQIDCDFFAEYNNIFIDTVNNTVHLKNVLGQDAPTGYFWGKWIGFYDNSLGVQYYEDTICGNYAGTQSFTANNYDNYQQVINAVFSQNINLFDNSRYFFQDFVRGCYAGTSWNDKVAVENLTDLDFQINNTPYYEEVQTDVLINIRDLIDDLINTINIPFDFDNTALVSIDLTPITNLLAPPVPVNLNEIAELTDNTYLERVKEHARNAGDIFANYVAFWHNCDSDLVYTFFGAGILVLVGAFIGKWGHS